MEGKWAALLLLIVVVLISGCVNLGYLDINRWECGDNICSDAESVDSCPQDCQTIQNESNNNVTFQEKDINDYLLMINKTCALENPVESSVVTAEFEIKNFRILIVAIEDSLAETLEDNHCVDVLTPAEAQDIYKTLGPHTKEMVREIIQEVKLTRTIKSKDLPEEPPELINSYQIFVTPDDSAIQAIAQRIHGSREAYDEAVSWTWVSEMTLNNMAEKWLKPHEFLINTPYYPANPVPGRITSDCSEQANTLVSLLRAGGIPPENVRVVLGEVDFDRNIGGHAWVEVYEDGQWFELEATSGPYWDDDSERLVPSDGIGYNYYKFFEYPSLEIWAYYNDFYYYNPRTGQGNPPGLWLQ